MAEGDRPDDSQKTEEPTPKKLQEARRKGQVPLSREVNNWVMLLVGTIVIAAMSPYMMMRLTDVMKQFFDKAHTMPAMPGGASTVLGQTAIEIIGILSLPMAILMLAAFLAPFVQIGPLFSAESIKPKLSKISIIKGFERLFSTRSLMEFAKGIAKLALIAAVGFIIIYPYYDSMGNMIGLPLAQVLDALRVLVLRMMIGVLVVLFVVAMIDLIYQRYQHYKQMRMTRQEVKDEFKQTEGDPHVRARLRQLRVERSRQRMMQSVPQADVVITNPTHYSIALKYDPDEMNAPVCVAKGIDEVALRIREVAKENGIILYENKPLARALFEVVEIDDAIPTEHYQAVAEIISFVFKQKGRQH